MGKDQPCLSSAKIRGTLLVGTKNGLSLLGSIAVVAVVVVGNGLKFARRALVHPSDSEHIALGEVVSGSDPAVVGVRDL